MYLVFLIVHSLHSVSAIRQRARYGLLTQREWIRQENSPLFDGVSSQWLGNIRALKPNYSALACTDKDSDYCCNVLIPQHFHAWLRLNSPNLAIPRMSQVTSYNAHLTEDFPGLDGEVYTAVAFKCRVKYLRDGVPTGHLLDYQYRMGCEYPFAARVVSRTTTLWPETDHIGQCYDVEEEEEETDGEAERVNGDQEDRGRRDNTDPAYVFRERTRLNQIRGVGSSMAGSSVNP